MLSVKHLSALCFEIRYDTGNVLHSNRGRGFYTDYRKKAMAVWTFRCYDDGHEPPNLWQRWYDDHPEVHGKHDAILRIIENQPVWNNEHYTDNMPGDVVEIRVPTKQLQWRIFGHYHNAGRQQFVVTTIGWHKGKQYKPRGVVGTAALRKIEVESGAANAPICQRPS